MDDLRNALERVAERGSPIGPDAVYERALRRARKAKKRDEPHTSRRTVWLSVAAAACVVVVIGAVLLSGGSDGGQSIAVTNERPHVGGSIKYGIVAPTPGGWCLYRSQLDDAGVQVASAIYDTLTAPGADGEIHPSLAASVTANRDATSWTIDLQPDVVFSDGSPLDAQVVKDNLDAYKDQSPQFGSELADLESVRVINSRTLRVSLARSWPAFPWHLWSNGRLGIMGARQLQNPATCSTNLIGTGPFVMGSRNSDGTIVVTRNRRYWRHDVWKQQLPYLDQITFVPQADDKMRLRALERGELGIMQTASSPVITKIRDDVSSAKLRDYEPQQFDSVTFTMLNATKAPFDHLSARRAFAYAVDRDALNRSVHGGILTNASGPFPPDTPGYLADPGWPAPDSATAGQYAAQYRQETGRDLTFSISYLPDAEATATADLLQRMLTNAGIDARLAPIADPAAFVNTAIMRTGEAILWRTDVGGDPDLQYSMWHCGNRAPAPCDNILNFAGFNDPSINSALDDGRVNADPAARRTDYERVNEQFASQAWAIWQQWTRRVIAYTPDVRGIPGPDLPDGTPPASYLGGGHSVVGIWISP